MSLASEDREVDEADGRGLSAGEIALEVAGVESTVSEVASLLSCGGEEEEMAVLAMLKVGC